MPASNGCFGPPEIANDFKVPVSAVRRTIDRLKLGTRINGARVVFSEDLDTLRLVFIGMGYDIPSPEPMQPSEMPVDNGTWE